MALDTSKVSNRVWHAGPLHKLKSYGISSRLFGHISSFLSSKRFQVVLDGKSSQEYQVNAGVPQGIILGPTVSLLCINDFPDDVTWHIAICADDTKLYSKCDQASDLWQNLVRNLNLTHENYRLGQEVAYWFQCWENITCFTWPV